MKHHALGFAVRGGESEDAVGDGRVGEEVVGAATSDFVQEFLELFVARKIKLEIVRGFLEMINGEDLPDGVATFGGSADDEVGAVGEPAVVQDIAKVAEHGNVETAMRIKDIVAAFEVGITARIEKNPTGGIAGAIEGMFEIIIVAIGLDKGIIDVGAGDLNPALSVVVDGF